MPNPGITRRSPREILSSPPYPLRISGVRIQEIPVGPPELTTEQEEYAEHQEAQQAEKAGSQMKQRDQENAEVSDKRVPRE